MHIENFLSFVYIGQVNVYLTVEPSGTKQRFVQDIGTVGGSQDYYTAVGTKTIHFSQ